MSKCGYYSCRKGIPKCSHPEKGDYKSQLLNEGKLYMSYMTHPCDRCRRECGGIYPSQLPKANFSNCEIDIIDKDGNIIIAVN